MRIILRASHKPRRGCLCLTLEAGGPRAAYEDTLICAPGTRIPASPSALFQSHTALPGYRADYAIGLFFNAYAPFFPSGGSCRAAEATQMPWVGRFAQYRRWHGVLLPTMAEASWVVDGQRQPYAHFLVQELEYEPLKPF